MQSIQTDQVTRGCGKLNMRALADFPLDDAMQNGQVTPDDNGRRTDHESESRHFCMHEGEHKVRTCGKPKQDHMHATRVSTRHEGALRPLRLTFGTIVNKLCRSQKQNIIQEHRITTTKLGEGSCGSAYVAIDKMNRSRLAVKVVDLKKVKLHQVLQECEILAKLNHPNIIRLHAHGFPKPSASQPDEEQMSYLIFMELAAGDLFEIVQNGISEARAQHFFRQLVAAVSHCHEQGVAHRDLKLENILITEDGTLKLIDFGLSHCYPIDATGRVDTSLRLHSCVGTASYAAGEVLAGDYDGFCADLWSLGVILFAMISNFFPLSQATNSDWRFLALTSAQKLHRSSMHTIYSWYNRSCDHMSANVISLLDSMLMVDPSRRINLSQVRDHPWVHSLS